MTPEERKAKMKEFSAESRHNVTEARREQLARARANINRDKQRKAVSAAAKAQWSEYTPEQRSEMMRERKNKSDKSYYYDPKYQKILKREYKKKAKKLKEARAEWAEEHPEAMYIRGKELSKHPMSKVGLDKCHEKHRRRQAAMKDARLRAEAVTRYQTNLNIKRIDADTDNNEAIDEFFGDLL